MAETRTALFNLTKMVKNLTKMDSIKVLRRFSRYERYNNKDYRKNRKLFNYN